jgi:2-polyprenyl-6-methoxyphenol hydroxylase-like FAD-dependent oxidoreductase
VTGVEQEAEGVTVTGQGLRLRARYAVGCDGGRSMVRRALGVPFPGLDGRISGVVADITISDEEGLTSSRWQLPSPKPGERGIVTLLPLPGGVHRLLYAERRTCACSQRESS